MSSDNKINLNEIKPHPDRTPSRAKSDVIDMTEDIPNAIPQKDGAQKRIGRCNHPHQIQAHRQLFRPRKVLISSQKVFNTCRGMENNKIEEEKAVKGKRKNSANRHHSFELQLALPRLLRGTVSG